MLVRRGKLRVGKPPMAAATNGLAEQGPRSIRYVDFDIVVSCNSFDNCALHRCLGVRDAGKPGDAEETLWTSYLP